MNFNKAVYLKDLLKILKELKTSKSAGYDNIPASLIKEGAEELAAPLLHLINSSLRESVFPTSEKCAKITPVYKSGERTKMDNYRPISVLPVLSKVLEKVVHKQIYEYLETNKLLSPNQFGFRRSRSTQHAVTYFSDYVRKHMDDGEYTGAVFVDLKKAFDTVDHGRLLSKLPSYGIKGKELSWFESYLFDRKQFVSMENSSSERKSVVCGVPQGSLLGPLLFVLLINDIDLQLKHCSILLYADDTVIFTADKNCKVIEERLNNDLNKIANWFSDNNLIINLKKGKTEYVLYGTAQRLAKSSELVIDINGQIINETETYEYLGVMMDKSLTYTTQIERVYKKASSRVKLLSRIRKNISPYVAETIYKVMIEPVLFYCNNVMLGISDSTAARFQDIQDRAHKVVFGKRERSNTWETVSCKRNRLCVLEVFKCLNGIAPINFNEYFSKNSHEKNTRGNNSLLKIPKVRTEVGRKTFAFQGARRFNQLDASARNETSILKFRQTFY